jgi:hypothetical protein
LKGGEVLERPPGQHADGDLQDQRQQQRLPDDGTQLGVAELAERKIEGADHGALLRADDAGGFQLADLPG